MEYAVLPLSEKKFSRLVYGTAADPIRKGTAESACGCLDLAFSYGFTVFDTAHSYGNAEKHLGIWLSQRNLRDKVILLTKGCNPGQHGSSDELTPECIRSQVTESLRRLQTDYLDLYLLHRDDVSRPVGPVIETLNLLKDRGAIRHFGASNWSLARFIEANQYAADRGLEGFTSVSPCYSPAVQIGDPSGHSVCISGPSGKSAREWYQEHSITVFSYSGLARGFLSGRFRSDGSVSAKDVLSPTCRQEYCYPENIELLRRAEQIAAQKGVTVAQVSLAWLLEQPMRPFSIISPTSEAHILDAVRAFSVHLTPEEQEQLTL